jgi:PleD family two-component response regulator
VSVSVGAITIENWGNSMRVDPFLEQLDVSLYQAKQAGRNRTICVEPLVAV